MFPPHTASPQHFNAHIIPGLGLERKTEARTLEHVVEQACSLRSSPFRKQGTVLPAIFDIV